MKKILMALILGFVFLPLPVTAQKWIDPYVRTDGTYVEGHWQSPKDSWQRSYNQPGTVNPLTGQFNPYGRRTYQESPKAYQSPQDFFGIPGSSGQNPYAVPGSSAPNPYAIPGSSPKPKAPNPDKLYN